MKGRYSWVVKSLALLEVKTEESEVAHGPTPGLCLNRTNRKDNHIRLRTSSQTIGEDGSKPNLNPNPNANPKPNTKPNPKKKKLRKET